MSINEEKISFGTQSLKTTKTNQIVVIYKWIKSLALISFYPLRQKSKADLPEYCIWEIMPNR
jgi:hypothetical protein